MKMTEENVTKSILKHLMDRGWRIVSFDYPQSGTGRSLHPHGSVSKNMGVLIPDVIAVKGGIGIYMENKDRYCHEDFSKVHNVLQGRTYSESFSRVFGISQESLVGGIGIPEECCKDLTSKVLELVDFVLKVGADGTVSAHYIAPGKNLYF